MTKAALVIEEEKEKRSLIIDYKLFQKILKFYDDKINQAILIFLYNLDFFAAPIFKNAEFQKWASENSEIIAKPSKMLVNALNLNQSPEIHSMFLKTDFAKNMMALFQVDPKNEKIPAIRVYCNNLKNLFKKNQDLLEAILSFNAAERNSDLITKWYRDSNESKSALSRDELS